MGDSLANGCPLRILNVVDDYSREAVATEVDFIRPDRSCEGVGDMSALA
jgi:hypothetical protein